MSPGTGAPGEAHLGAIDGMIVRMAGSLTVKRSFTIPRHLIDQAQARSGPRGLSAYLTQALEAQLRVDRLSEYVAAAEAEQGPVSDDVLAQVYADIDAADSRP